MNKQKDIEKLNTFKFRKKTIELFKEQITCFYENKNLQNGKEVNKFC